MPRKFHGQKSLAGYNSWGHKESDATEHAHIHTHTHTHTHEKHLAWGIMLCQVLKRGGCGEFLIDRHKLSVDQMTDPLYNIASNNTMYTDTFIKRVDLMLSILSTITIKE